MALGMWTKNLPTYVKVHISDEVFNADTYKAVFDKADKCWLSHRQETPVVAAIKAENVAALKDSTDFDTPAVAAIRGRGRGRGNGRGGRGGRGGGRGGQGTKPLGPRHPQALEGSCYVHHKFGPEAWSCADRHKCPMRDMESPRPRHNRNIPVENKNEK